MLLSGVNENPEDGVLSTAKDTFDRYFKQRTIQRLMKPFNENSHGFRPDSVSPTVKLWTMLILPRCWKERRFTVV